MLIETADPQAIVSIALLRASSTTHTNNMDQRYVGLPIRERTQTQLRVGGPANSAVAPPGPYLLFLVNGDRVPSEGRIIDVAESKESTVPYVVGLSQAQAAAKVKAVALIPSFDVYGPGVRYVVSQAPAAGAKVPRGSTVDMKVSGGEHDPDV
jgi:hypothetical protein